MAKQTFGKDAKGTFHPGKGKPSGINKEEGLGMQPTPPEKMDEYIEMTEKYLIEDDLLDPSVRFLHPNRNTSKKENVYKGKENSPESEKSTNETFAEPGNKSIAEQLPGVITAERFKELASYRGECCISLYLKVHSVGVEVNEKFDPINFKNRLQEITQQLIKRGESEARAKQLLQPGFDLVRNDEFWKSLSPGLAIFISDNFFKFIKMPVEPIEETLMINHNFSVAPLIPLLNRDEYFYLLVLSKHGCKLFKGDYWGMQIVPVELPGSVDEVKRLSGLDATTFRSGETGSRAPAASQEGSYHGTGGGNPDGKDNLLTYFEAVDDVLWEKILNKENVPLVLAGVEYEIPIYRQACDYKNVWPDALTGSREHQATYVLYEDVKKLMMPYFEQKKVRALETYMNNSANALTSSIAADIIPAAHYAQVDTLFVCKGEHIWGRFDEQNNQLQLEEAQTDNSEDLLDIAIVRTLGNGGSVFMLEKEQMPAETQMAALMRY